MLHHKRAEHHKRVEHQPGGPGASAGIATEHLGHGVRREQGEEHPSRARLALLAVLLTAQMMVILDITAVNIALPSLARDLELSGSTVSWTITSYSLIFGSLLLFGGRAADLLGRRRLFLTGLGIFT